MYCGNPPTVPPPGDDSCNGGTGIKTLCEDSPGQCLVPAGKSGQRCDDPNQVCFTTPTGDELGVHQWHCTDWEVPGWWFWTSDYCKCPCMY